MNDHEHLSADELAEVRRELAHDARAAAERRRSPETRLAALEQIRDLLEKLVADGRRL